MRIKFFLLLKIHLFFVVSVWGDLLEKQAWEKAYPQNLEDLMAIQAQLQSLLPDAEKAVVSIETGDGAWQWGHHFAGWVGLNRRTCHRLNGKENESSFA